MLQPSIRITGIGAICALGSSWQEIGERLLAGANGIRRVSRFDPSELPSQMAGEVDQVPTPEGWDPSTFAKKERAEQMILWCCAQALRESGWWGSRQEARIGLCLGMGAEWLLHWEADVEQASRVEESLLDRAQRELRIRGPKLTVAAACASGNYAIEQGRRWLELGLADVCLVGGAEPGAVPVGMSGFGNLRALSQRNDEPECASRPFDRDRDGFVLGEGGAILVLETAESAQRRGKDSLAEIVGYGSSSDAHHLIIPSTDPQPAASAVLAALCEAQLNPEDVDYVNAHATSTPVGDVGEAKILRKVFRDDLPQLPVSATKSMTGHLLSGAAALEAMICVLALQRQAIPPTINLDNPDPECDLYHVANEAEERPVNVAMSNSFGFGGSNTCLVLRKAS